MKLVLDAMGGDHAPDQIVKGALEVLDDLGEDRLVLVGDESRLQELLKARPDWQDYLSVVHAPEVIGMDESPVDALRRKRKSSIAMMAKMASDGEADVVISAGNTGACVASCQLRMRLLPGVLRPGILVIFPTMNGPVAICDVGANVTPKPVHLHQYAAMGCLYMQAVVGIQSPTVGLMSIGEEDTKGNDLIKKANQMLREDAHLEFIGNVEAREVLNKPCDVIVCDGFVGNVVLKMAEGIAEGLFRAVNHELTRLKPELVQEFKPIMQSVYAQHDHTEYGGAPLLGVDGFCIICHGASDARAIRNAILRARELAQTGINQKLVDWLQEIPVSELEAS